MSSIDHCLTRAVADKTLTQEDADALREEIGAHEMLEQTDAGKASRAMQVLEDKERDILRRKANAARQAQINVDLVQAARQHPRGTLAGALAHLVRDRTGMAQYGNVDSQQHIWQRRLQAKITDATKELRAKGILGQKVDFLLAEKVALEMRGKDTGDAAAKRLAGVFAEAFEEARVEFNKQGGDIKKRPDWGTPQFHDVIAILNGSKGPGTAKAEWKAFVTPLLDLEKMRLPNGAPLTPGQLDVALNTIFRAFSTGKPAVAPWASKATANMRLDHRFLVFKDADSWLTYNRRYGEKDVFAGFVHHLDGLAREVALMRTLGPIPEAGFLALQNAVRETAGYNIRHGNFNRVQNWARKKGWRVNGPEGQAYRLQSAWDTVAGNNGNIPGTLQQMSAAVRAMNTTTKLGGAALSSLADEGTMAMTAAWNGISMVGVMRREIQQLTSEEQRVWAMRAWIGWESWMRAGVATNRFADEAIGKGFYANAAEATMRASGLNALTDARRAAFGMEFLGALGDAASKPLAVIRLENPKLARALEHYAISDKDWAAMRENGLVDFDGAKYVHPEALANSGHPHAEDLVEKLMRMVLTETDFAVPTPGALERSMVTMGTRGGTGAGEVVRHLGQFKSFSITMATTHLSRAFNQAGLRGKANYLIPYVIVTTGAGAVALQAKAVAYGKTPLDMTRPSFWLAALAQGGGLGLFGDYLYQGLGGQNRFGNSFATSLLGPTFGMFTDSMSLFSDTVGGDLAPKQVTDYALRHLVPGSSLWYTRLMLERAFTDQLKLLSDEPSARRTFAAKEAFASSQGSEFYWKPGHLLPNMMEDGQ